MPKQIDGVSVNKVDLNDLQLATEPLEGFDPDADAHALPPPPDDGKHLVKLSRMDKPWKQRADANGKILSFSTSVRADSVDIEPRYVLFDHRVSTRVARGGGSTANDIIKAVTGNPAAARDHKSVAKQLDQLLQGEPLVTVETRWLAECQDCKDTNASGYENNHRIKAGQKNFPLLKKDGIVRNHQIECDQCGAIVSAQAQIVRYLPAAQRAAPPLTVAESIQNGAESEEIAF